MAKELGSLTGFHPGERDYGVATNEAVADKSHNGNVSIPASGIMVLLRVIMRKFLNWGQWVMFPSRRAGLWCCY